MEQLLTGLKVVDLSRGMAGAIASMQMGDNGAEVIKLEPPEGDFLRNQLPHHVWNRNKRSAVADLKTDAGKALAHKLLADADILIENFRPGQAERFGLGFDELHRKYPRLVHVSITGYGTWGPREDAPGYEPLVDAWLGIQAEQPGWRPGPHYNVLQVASYGAGMLATMGALAALRARDQNGRGQHVETSLVEGALVLLTMNWGWAEKDPGPPPFNNPSPGVNVVRRHMMTFGILPAGDGKFMQMHSGQPGKFFKSMEIFGIKEKIEFIQPHLEKSAPLSAVDKEFLEREVPRILKTKPRAEWIRLFKENDIVALEVDPAGSAVNEPQVIHDGTIQEVNDPVLGRVKMTGPVLKCPEAPPAITRPAPRLGEHTDEVIAKGWLSAVLAPKAPGKSVKHPLEGVKIVDFGSYFAGPYASRLLCDLGAEVIKVEPPAGDTLRPTVTAFRAGHRGKRSVVVDMKLPEGRTLQERLIKWADVVTHNMRPGVGERLGLAYEDVKKLSPKVVYLHSTGFGGSGPRALEGAFAPLVAGLCGLAAQAAGEGNVPVQSISNEDHHSGTLGACWLTMGLAYVARTGKPIALNTSLLGATLFVTSEVLLKPDNSPLFRYELDQDQTGLGPLCRMYKAKDDRWVCLVIEQEKEWKRLVGVPGLEKLGTDSRFATREGRNTANSALTDALSGWFAARSASEAEGVLKAAKVPAEISAASHVMDIFFDEDNFKHGRIVEYHHQQFGKMRESGHYVRFSETPGKITVPSPLLGEHSREVLKDLGLSEAEMMTLREKKVTAWPA